MMKLTDGEKLILLMLADQNERNEVRNEIDAEFIRSAILYDHLWAIPWQYPGIPFESSEDPAEVKEVVDVLEMWSILENGYNNLSEQDKGELIRRVGIVGQDVAFPGFDGNNESRHLAIASFFIDELDRFQVFRGRYLNSHSPSLEIYRRMLKVFMPLLRSVPEYPLTLDNMVSILKERIHPEHREE